MPSLSLSLFLSLTHTFFLSLFLSIASKQQVQTAEAAVVIFKLRKLMWVRVWYFTKFSLSLSLSLSLSHRVFSNI